jgi:hypothetical protein
VLAERFQLNDVAAAILAVANAYFTKRPCDDLLIKSVELVMLGKRACRLRGYQPSLETEPKQSRPTREGVRNR